MSNNNYFINLEKIIESLNNVGINDLIRKDEFLFVHKDIRPIKNIYNLFKELKKIYSDSLIWLYKNISHITIIQKMFIRKKINYRTSSNIYNDLFLEIESIIAFALINFEPNLELLMQFEYSYHHLKSLLIYLFSIFDTIACLLRFHHSKDEEFSNSILQSIKFHNVNTYLLDNDEIKNSILKKRIDDLIRSHSYMYVKKIRNAYYHHFDHPHMRYHFSSDIMVCFITVIKLIQIIKTSL